MTPPMKIFLTGLFAVLLLGFTYAVSAGDLEVDIGQHVGGGMILPIGTATISLSNEEVYEDVKDDDCILVVELKGDEVVPIVLSCLDADGTETLIKVAEDAAAQ